MFGVPCARDSPMRVSSTTRTCGRWRSTRVSLMRCQHRYTLSSSAAMVTLKQRGGQRFSASVAEHLDLDRGKSRGAEGPGE